MTAIAVLVVLFFVFIIGLCIGSFLNVVILRALSGESIVFPASKCPSCQTPLKWWHNIPVLSYILLKGKCAYCHEKISIQYPIIELVTGLVYVLAVLKYSLNFDTIFILAAASLFIVLAGTDIKEKVVFDRHTYALVGVGLVYNFLIAAVQLYAFHHIYGTFNVSVDWIINNTFTSAILGIIAGIIIMEAVARLGYILAGTRAFGEGDTFIAAGLGAMFGWRLLLSVLIISLIIQVIITLPIFFKKLICSKDWYTIGSLVAFFAYAAAFITADYTKLIPNIHIYMLCALVLVVLGLLTCWRVLRGMKENPEKMTYLPFGPAMVIAGFIVLLF